MKRTPIRVTQAQVDAWQAKPRTPIVRTALKRGKGRKALREADARAAFRAALIERSGGECEAPWGIRVLEPAGFWRIITVAHSHTADRHLGSDPHHVWPEDRDCGRHDPERGLWICSAAHRWAHAEPRDAALVGILRPS